MWVEIKKFLCCYRGLNMVDSFEKLGHNDTMVDCWNILFEILCWDINFSSRFTFFVVLSNRKWNNSTRKVWNEKIILCTDAHHFELNSHWLLWCASFPFMAKFEPCAFLCVQIVNRTHTNNAYINSSPTSAACMRQWIGSTFVQILACWLFSTRPLSKLVLVCCQLNP